MLTHFRQPQKQDVAKSFGLMKEWAINEGDSPLSELGKKQAETMGNMLRECDFKKEQSIQLIVHSPLSRARDSCMGILGCCAERENGPDNHAKESRSSIALLELECLREATPYEQVLPGGRKKMMKRIHEFELWLAGRQEESIAVVRVLCLYYAAKTRCRRGKSFARDFLVVYFSLKFYFFLVVYGTGNKKTNRWDIPSTLKPCLEWRKSSKIVTFGRLDFLLRPKLMIAVEIRTTFIPRIRSNNAIHERMIRRK